MARVPEAVAEINDLINNMNGKKNPFDKPEKGVEDNKGNNAGSQNTTRGFVRSEWFTPELLEQNPEIAALMEGLSATTWVYYTGDGEGSGLYWTSDDLNSLDLHYKVNNNGTKANDASQETVMYYHYNPNATDGKNYEIVQSQI